MPTPLPAKSTDSTERAVRRILLALDSAQDAMALEAAAELAALLSAELETIFVENTELLRLAQLPFAYEISLTSAAGRRLDAQQLERDLKAQAERVRRMLERRALQQQLQWSFRIERGMTAALIADRPIDLYVLGRPHAPTEVTPRQAGSVLTVFDGSLPSHSALAAAAALAGRNDGLLVLLPQAKLRSQAETLLRELGVEAHYLVAVDLTPAALATATRRHRSRVLVLGDSAPLSPAQLQQLLGQSACPVAIAR